MARKRASLLGRGAEILMGASQDEPSEAAAVSESQDRTGVDDSLELSAVTVDLVGESRVSSDDGRDLSPELMDLLEGEALSATMAGQTGSDEASLPALATTPARPRGPADRAGNGAEMPVLDDEPALEIAGVEEREGAKGDALTGVEGEPKPMAEPAAEILPLPMRSPAPDGASVGSTTPGTVPEPVPGIPPAPYGESDADAATGALVPVPKEKPEATDPLLRAKLDGLLYQRATLKPSDEDLELEGPEVPDLKIEGLETERPLRHRREPEMPSYVDRAQQEALWEETIELYHQVPNILSGDENQVSALQLLQEAQEILLEKPRRYDVAQLKVGQVRAMVSWRHSVNHWSNTYGWGIFVYEVIWIAALAMGVFGAEFVAKAILGLAAGQQAIGLVLGLWSTVMWGGLGGVLGAFYSLYWHVAKVRDFDKRYTMWYIVQPLIGLLIGALVYLLIGTWFLTGRGATAQDEIVELALFPYAVACIAGFRQRFVLEMIDRVIQVITPSPQRESPPAEETDTEEQPEPSEQ